MMGNVFELGVPFILGIHEILDLSHLELAYSHQTISRGNLVSEAETDLASTEGHSAAVELQQFMEIDENALSSFGSEVAYQVCGRTDFCLEHEIELFGSRQLVSSVRRFDFQLFHDFVHLIFAVTVGQ